MKIVLEIECDGNPKENDVIAMKKGRWKVVSKESFLSEHIARERIRFHALEERTAKLEKDLVSIAKILKEK